MLDLLHKPAHPFYSRYREWALAAVEKPAFWKGNFLSSDRRVPVTLIGTNAGRALATNAIAGHMWEDFTSDTYKQLPPVGQIQIYNPYKPQNGDETFNDSFTAPGGGRGYYRPASFVSIWATAPYLHNNSVGIFNNDPSVKGRMEAFDDGIRKLLVQAKKDDNDTRSWDELWTEAAKKRYLGYKDERLGWKAPDLDHADPAQLERDHGLIWRTTEETTIQIPGSQLGDLAHRLTGLPAPFPGADPVDYTGCNHVDRLRPADFLVQNPARSINQLRSGPRRYSDRGVVYSRLERRSQDWTDTCRHTGRSDRKSGSG